MQMFYKKVHYFSYNCVVLFDANVSLYFVIGCSGFQTRTQPRYSSSRLETVILYAHIDWVIEVWPLAVYDFGSFQHIFNRGIPCNSPRCFKSQSFILALWKIACKCQGSALITGSAWSNRFKVFPEQVLGRLHNLIPSRQNLPQHLLFPVLSYSSQLSFKRNSFLFTMLIFHLILNRWKRLCYWHSFRVPVHLDIVRINSHTYFQAILCW